MLVLTEKNYFSITFTFDDTFWGKYNFDQNPPNTTSSDKCKSELDHKGKRGCERDKHQLLTTLP